MKWMRAELTDVRTEGTMEGESRRVQRFAVQLPCEFWNNTDKSWVRNTFWSMRTARSRRKV